MADDKRLGVGVLGATGYSGGELLYLLLNHPNVELRALSSRTHAGSVAGSVLPGMPELDLVFDDDALSPDGWRARGVEMLFACLPHGVFASRARAFLQAGMRLIDLSGDFRLRQAVDYPQHYQFVHPDPDLLSSAVYGLCEWADERLRAASLVANPGCYATAILLALLPAAAQQLLSPGPVIVTAMSGVSGAGRGTKLATQFGECAGSVAPYKVGEEHAHLGEMNQALKGVEAARTLIFNPHLVPMARGIVATVAMPLAQPCSAADVLRIYQECYASQPFVQLLADDRMVETRYVRGSNRCDLALRVVAEGKTLLVFSAIDNLVKGAAGQAIQNMNCMQGWSQTLGLPRRGIPCI